LADQPVSTAQSPRPGKLTTTQMLHLMRLEVDRAQRTKTPISCVVASLDSMERQIDAQVRQTLIPAVFRALKAVTVEHDVRGLGLTTGNFVLAVFPHVEPAVAATVGQELLSFAEQLSDSPLAPGREVSLSVGVSHNLRAGECSLESLVEEAETGLALAQESGGGRCVQWKDVESEIDRLKVELDEQLKELAENDALFQAESDGDQKDWGAGLVEAILQLFHEETASSEEMLRLEQKIVALVKDQAEEWRGSSTMTRLLESQGKIETLERRLRKLTDTLGQTEAELKRVAALKEVDTGVASIYRTVQGLSGEDDNAEAKRAMLQDIFEANLALREATSEG
jgi:GGDEF domain-containing protein